MNPGPVNNRKLVVFDLDGTLLEGNSWATLHQLFGMTEDEDTLLYKLNAEGAIPNDRWVEIVNRLYRSRGKVTYEQAQTALINSREWKRDALWTIQELRDNGAVVALLSGAPDIVVRWAAEKLSVDLWRAGASFYFDNQGVFEQFTYEDEEVKLKLTQLNDLIAKSGVDRTHVYVIADGANDELVFNSKIKGITFKDSVIASNAWRIIRSLNEVPSLINLT